MRLYVSSPLSDALRSLWYTFLFGNNSRVKYAKTTLFTKLGFWRINYILTTIQISFVNLIAIFGFRIALGNDDDFIIDLHYATHLYTHTNKQTILGGFGCQRWYLATYDICIERFIASRFRYARTVEVMKSNTQNKGITRTHTHTDTPSKRKWFFHDWKSNPSFDDESSYLFAIFSTVHAY